MSRGIGAFEAIYDLVPESAAVPFALLTNLADAWFLVLLLGSLYWTRNHDREAIAIVFGAWVAGTATTTALKGTFRLPRPTDMILDPALPTAVQPMYEAAADAGGYGFPSGHAISATIVYLGLAYVLSVSTPRRRYVVAMAIVTIVAFTRVALGVHFVVDVVAGVAVGLALLYVVSMLWNRYPDEGMSIAFGIAVLLGGGALVLSGSESTAFISTAVALGGFAGSQLNHVVAESRTGGSSLINLGGPPVRLAFAGIALVPLLGVVGHLLISVLLGASFVPNPMSLAMAGVAGLVTTGGLVAPELTEARSA